MGSDSGPGFVLEGVPSDAFYFVRKARSRVFQLWSEGGASSRQTGRESQPGTAACKKAKEEA
jgi:hypothetical protein